MIETNGCKGAAEDKGNKVATGMHQTARLVLAALVMIANAAPAPATDPPKVRLLNEAPSSSEPGRQPDRGLPKSPTPPKLHWAMSWWGLPRTATAGSERLAELIRAKTDGRWTLKIHYGAALSRANRNLDGLREGRFQMAAFCDFFHPRKNPALTVLSLPFLPLARPETNRRVRDAVYAHPAVRAEMANLGVRLYTSTYLPPFELLGRGAPPSHLGYWKGRAVRAGSGIGQAMAVLGAIPVNATLPEIADGLGDGAIQVAALPLSYVLTNSAIRQSASWYTSNLAAGSSECPIAISQSAYAKLPPAYKTLLEKVRPVVIDAQLRAWQQSADVKPAPGSPRPRKIELTPAEIAVYRRTAGRPVIDAWIEQYQTHFDARGLVQAVFRAGGLDYE